MTKKSFIDAIDKYLKEGQNLMAVKLVCNTTNLGLMKSKNLVDEVRGFSTVKNPLVESKSKGVQLYNLLDEATMKVVRKTPKPEYV
jgi:ribosomal protein L7/L12